MVRPKSYFRSIDQRGGFAAPLVFALVCSAISAPLGALLAPYDPLGPRGGALAPEIPAGWFAETGAVAGALLVLFVALVVLLLLLLGIYVGAGICHLLVLLFAGGRHAGFNATFKAYAYSSAASLLSWVPVAGYAASLYGLYLLFTGLRELHGMPPPRALLAVAPLAALQLSSLAALL
ncbi:YIP1 family protein [Rubrobacter xylanophilus]|nr:YIP1 family protein [Rubrobacter xylanophilus]